MGQYRRILQVVGYQNSGKTTLVEKIIRAAVEKGLKVGSIKHHGHGGKPDAVRGKDSNKHAEAGAQLAAVEGENVVQIEWNPDVFDIEKLLALYEFCGIQFVVIEGYKRAAYEKVVLLKEPEDAVLLTLPNVVAAVYWPHFPKDLIGKHEAICLDDVEKKMQTLLEKEG